MSTRKRKRGSNRLNVSLPGHVSEQFIRELLEALPDDGSFKSEYLRKELLSKYCDSNTTPADVRTQAAITKWLSVERKNARTNQRLFYMDVDFGWIHSEEFCSQVRSLISRILGPVRYPDVLMNTGHTNGASTRIGRGPASAVLKLTGEGHVSESALKHWFALASGTVLSNQTLGLKETSTMFTVPKKSDIDRVACKEPEINMLLQRSVGLHIRRSLRRYGQNLNDQTVNQRLASVALREGLATIDLSSASDSISNQLVLKLLPFEWWSLLDDLRVKSTLIGDEEHSLEMFSSMGNGFTFELESLLFYAITRVICWRSGVKGRISVFGDDIIAPTAVVKRLKRVFDFLGFSMNPKKTHFKRNDLLRESCGRHYHRGFDVTPFYIRREVATLPDLINHLNHVLGWDASGWGFFHTPELARFHRKWSQWVPRRLHGGVSTEDPSRLVTGDGPRHRLVPISEPMSFDNDAGLKHWLLTKQHVQVALHVDPKEQVGFKTKPVTAGPDGSEVTWEGPTYWAPYLITEEMEL